MTGLRFIVQTYITLGVSVATPRAPRPLVRMVALQLVGIARYYSSLRLALHPMEHPARAVQLRFLGCMV